LKRNYHKPLSSFAFNFNLCRYSKEEAATVIDSYFDRADVNGRAVQVEPMKPMFEAPGTKRLKL